MADFFKGLAGGFGTGLQFGQAVRERNMRDELAQAYAKPETSQGFTAEQGQQLEAMASAINPETGRPYYRVQAGEGGNYTVTPDFTEAQTPRTGMGTGSQYGVASLELQPTGLGRAGVVAQPIPFNQQQVQDYGGRRVAGQFDPTELRGLQMQEAARVLGSYGDVRGAAALQAQAEEQAYQAKVRPLQLQQLEGSVAGQAQQRELTGLQLERGKREEAAAKRVDDFSAFAAERPDMSVADLKNTAFKEFKFTPKQWEDVVTTRLNIDKADLSLFKANVQKKLQGKSLSQLGELYNTDPDFDDKTDLAIVPGKNGAVTLNFIDKATGRVASSQAFKNQALATEYLNKQATEPETIGSWMLSLQKTESGIAAQNAATQASLATTGLRGAQIEQIRESGKYAKDRADLIEKFQDLDEKDQAGEKGQGLIKQFNLLNAKAGGQVSIGPAPRVAGPARELSDLDKENLRYYRDWVKDPKNAKLPQGQKDAFAAELGVTPFIKRDTAGPESGLGANVYAAPQQGITTRAPAAAPAARSAAPAPAALTTENTKLLGRAGNTGYNVQLPDGTTQVMSISQLNKLGYQFPGGTGLQRAWYEDLLPR